MITKLVCFAILFIADPAPTQVSARVLFGTGDESQKVEIEPWIGKALAEAGSPVATPGTAWVKLTGAEQRLYTSPQGGFIIDGKATERNGKYAVEINGCAGGPLQQSVTLNPGERRVIKLTDDPAPTNVFVAVAAGPPADESISVTVVGTLRTAVVAIGGETTGTTITAKGATWELDFGKHTALRAKAKSLDGKLVSVIGTLERRPGVEVKERWIVVVKSLE